MAGVPPKKKDSKALVASVVGFVGSFIYMGAQYVVDNPDSIGSLVDNNMVPTVTMVCTLITGLYKAFNQNKTKAPSATNDDSEEGSNDPPKDDTPIEEGKE